MLTTRILTSKLLISTFLILSILPVFIWHRDSLKSLAVLYPRPSSRPNLPQFIASGPTQCLPPTTPEMVQNATHRRATCRKFSPFTNSQTRIATVTAHFGNASVEYQTAFQTHLLHSIIHSTELRVLCDPIIDSLWNKPAFILELLISEMLKSTDERLEWLMWADRDTMILDQCRPISSFLPPPPGLHAHTHTSSKPTQVNILVTNDFNGLNNGVFLLRVNEWAISLFTSILAFRHYEPDVELPYTEQSAMELVLQSEEFRKQTRYVPQYWFNAYDWGGASEYALRTSGTGDEDIFVRRGDYIVHFAGGTEKEKSIEEYAEMLEGMGDVWEVGSVVRDVSREVGAFWRGLGD